MDYLIGRIKDKYNIQDTKNYFQALNTDKTNDTDIPKIIDKNDIKEVDIDKIVKTLTAMAEDIVSGNTEYQSVFVAYLTELPNMAIRDTATKIKNKLFNALLPLDSKYVQADVEKFYNIKVGEKSIKEYLSDAKNSEAAYQTIPDKNTINSSTINNNGLLNNNNPLVNNNKPKFNYFDVFNRLRSGAPGLYFDDANNAIDKALLPNYSLGFNFELEPTPGFLVKAITDISTRNKDGNNNMPPINFDNLALGLGYSFEGNETIAILPKTDKLVNFVEKYKNKFTYVDKTETLVYKGVMSKDELAIYLSEDLSEAEKNKINSMFQSSQSGINYSVSALFGVIKPMQISSFTDFQRFQYINDNPGKFGFGLDYTLESKTTKLNTSVNFTTPPVDDVNEQNLFGIPDPTVWSKGEYEVLYNIALKTKTYQDNNLYLNHYLAAGNKKQAITEVDLSYVNLYLDVAHSFVIPQNVKIKDKPDAKLEWSIIPDVNYAYTRSWRKDNGAEEFYNHVIGFGAELALKIPGNDVIKYTKPYINLPFSYEYTQFGANEQTFTKKFKMNPSIGAEFNFGSYGSLFTYFGGNIMPWNENSYIGDSIYNPSTGNWDDQIVNVNKGANGFFFGVGYTIPIDSFMKATK